MLRVGTVLYGYCGGYFGRSLEAYDDKRIEAIGADWVVARSVDSANGEPLFFQGDINILEEYTDPASDPHRQDYWPDDGRQYSGLE